MYSSAVDSHGQKCLVPSDSASSTVSVSAKRLTTKAGLSSPMLRMRRARHRLACPPTITLQPRSFLQPHAQLLQADLHDSALFSIIPYHGLQHSREAAASSAVTEGADSSCTHSLQDLLAMRHSSSLTAGTPAADTAGLASTSRAQLAHSRASTQHRALLACF